MKVVADFHIHSRFSRACSKQIIIPNLAKWAQIKGIDILATGDFTHPQWLAEIEKELIEDGSGLLKLKNKEYPKTHFILSTEISCIYKKGDKTRKIHLCILFPDIKSVKKFNKELINREKNLKSDGRPILGIDAREIVDIALKINEKALIIPAHIWTPWFAILGSKSGFDSIEECFEDYTKYIYALETGLSSDPLMNWRVSDLDKFLLMSNSDAHSLENLGREANVMDLDELSYSEIFKIIKNKNRKKFLHTLEFYPEEGMYQNDGHRNCDISFLPEESLKNKNICPVCKKPLTIGVLNRVNQLADRSKNEVEKIKKQFIPYKSLIPLKAILSEILNVGAKSKKVDKAYFEILKNGENEFNILLDLELNKLKKITTPEVVEAIKRIRIGDIQLKAGYDGKYGSVKIFKTGEIAKIHGEQKKLI